MIQQNLPDRILDIYLFENIRQMRNYSETWMWMYNNERSHKDLQYRNPCNANEFPTFQQNFNSDNKKLLIKNFTFECTQEDEITA